MLTAVWVVLAFVAAGGSAMPSPGGYALKNECDDTKKCAAGLKCITFKGRKKCVPERKHEGYAEKKHEGYAEKKHEEGYAEKKRHEEGYAEKKNEEAYAEKKEEAYAERKKPEAYVEKKKEESYA